MKSGATPDAMANDNSDCSAISWSEAERLNPYGPQISTPGALDPVSLAMQQKVDTRRFEDARRLHALCMRDRGYQMQKASGP